MDGLTIRQQDPRKSKQLSQSKGLSDNNLQLNWVKFLNIVMKKSGVNVTDDTQVLCSNGFNQILYATIKTVEEASSDLLKNFALLRLFVYQALDSDAQTREAFEIYYKSRGNQVYSR